MSEVTQAGASASEGVALVVTTLPDSEAASRIVRQLLDEGLIACGTLSQSVESIYRWEGRIVAENEIIVLLKTSTGAISPVQARLAELHPYEVPEIVEIPTGSVSASYGRWVAESTRIGG